MIELMDTTDTTDVSIEILECQKQLKYWTKRLEKLKASVRRKTVLALIEYASSDRQMKRLWSQLTAEEQEDSEIVYKILSSGKNVFGKNPWDTSSRRGRGEEKLSPRFSSDPKAFLAFLFAPRSTVDDMSLQFSLVWSDAVPESLRDNKEVMMAVCSKRPGALEYASIRLRDDDEVVRAALLERDHRSTYRYKSLSQASERLRADTGLIRTLLERTVRIGRDNYCSFDWLEFAILDLTEERAVVHTILSHASDLHLSDTKFLEHFSEVVRDDKEIMLRFVSLKWESLQYCSARLKQDQRFVGTAVSQDVRAYFHAAGAIREQYVENRTVGSVLEEIANGSCEIPESMKTDRSVVMAALKARRLPWLLSDLPEHIRHDKEIVLAYIACGKKSFDCWYKYDDDGNRAEEHLYTDLPAHLQNDQEIAIALLEAGYGWFEEIFELMPFLICNRKAMLAAACIYSDFDDVRLPIEFLEKSPFRNDAEFMLTISDNNVDYLECASDQLLSDRDFMEAACTTAGSASMTYAPPEFQINNIDLVVKAIQVCLSYAKDKFAEHVHPGVWSHRPVVLAWLAKGWPILQKLASIDPNNTFLGDREIVASSVTNEPSDLRHAARSLRNDRAFILSLVQQADGVLKYAAKSFRKDDEILVAAIGRNGGTIAECFGLETGFDFLSKFAVRVRTKVKLHQSFRETFLRGISIHDQSQVPPANRCQLPLLDRGLETSTAFKRKIAEYVGVPLGAEFHSLQATSAALEKFGY